MDYTDENQIRACWHPDNLQWLLAEENLSKSGKYDAIKLKEYLEKHSKKMLD